MINTTVKILLIEDSLAEARLLQELFKDAKNSIFKIVHVQRLQEGIKAVNRENFDVILLDLTLPDSQGLSSLTPLMSKVPQVPIVVLTNTNDDQLALEAVRQGAQDYLMKRQVNLEMLVRSVSYAIERSQVSRTLHRLNEMLEMQLQDQMSELMKAKQLNQQRSNFVSMISHDFRNPLTTILLTTGLLQENGHKLSPAQKVRQYQRIRSAIQNMTGLLDEILLVGKSDAGKLKCQLVPLNLNHFCADLIEDFRLTIHEGHQLVFTSQGELNSGLWDENLLKHILANLLSNSIKYSPAGGIITLTIIRQGEQVVFRVQDQGLGISEEDQQRLFNPFQRGSNIGNISGTGLGLAIVKNCLEVHGGQITVESQENQGSTFTVTLPYITEIAS